MDIWTTMNYKKRVCTIGKTKCWSNDASLTKIVGYFNNPVSRIFVKLTLTEIKISSSIKPEICCKACGLKAGLCKYDKIVTTQLYLRYLKKLRHFLNIYKANGST